MGSDSREDLSFTIWWSLHPITALVPFIGHMGIANSKGVASEFAHTGIANSKGVGSEFQGPCCVGDVGQMPFWNPTRALKMDIGDLPGGAERWDDAVIEANQIYRDRTHNICCDNCHSHVACALNSMELRAYGIEKWDMVKLCFLIFFRGRFLSPGGFLSQFLPFAIIVTLLRLLMKLT